MKPRALLQEKHLGRYKLPENIYAEKDEGYDGHIKWELTEEILVMMSSFRDAVHCKEKEIVTLTLESLGAAASEAQLDHISSLILSGSVEQIKEALLSAICIGSRPLTEFILCLFADFPHEERSGCAQSDAFPPHLTPLVLACINNNFALVECLLLRGHSIDLPHHKNCGCETCQRQPYAVLTSVCKIDILRGVSSDAYLWLATDDPFSAACALATDLERYIREENLEFTEWYKGLYKAVQCFATRIINQNWSAEELDLFFSHKCDCDLAACEAPYPRVQMALDSGMRDFVASTNVQRAMDEIWWRGWGNFGANLKRDAYRMIRHTLFYPILALLYIVSHGRLARSFDVPLGRYITNWTAYLTFALGLIYLRHLRTFPANLLDAHFTLEVYVYSFVLGMIADRYMLFCRQGFRIHFQFWWRWFDFLLIGTFLLASHIWFIRLFVPYDRALPLQDRKHWDPWDYSLFYDVYLSTGSMLAVWRILYYFQLHKSLGGSIISVGRCVGYVYNVGFLLLISCFQYLVIICIIGFSFAVGLTMLQMPYGRAADGRPQFSSLLVAVRNLYWANFGYMEGLDVDNSIGNAGPTNSVQFHPTHDWGMEMLLAIYHLIVVITILNLMVSLLVKKAEEVLDNEEMEFKFIRVVIASEYLHWSSAVPPPFNLLLIFKECCYRMISTSYVKQWPEIFVQKDLVDVDKELAQRECSAYKGLLKKTFLRFRASKEYHYKSVFRADAAIKEKPTFAMPKVAYMSDKNDASGANAHPRIDFNETFRKLNRKSKPMKRLRKLLSKKTEKQ